MSRKGENIYKRKDGRWEGRYKKGRKANGSLKYGYIYEQKYTEVKNRLYHYKMEYQQVCQTQGECAMNDTEWSETWLDSCKKR